MRDGFVARQHAGDGEKAGLEDGVRAGSEADFPCDGRSIDHEKPELFVDDLCCTGRGR